MSRSITVVVIGLSIFVGIKLINAYKTYECFDEDGRLYECSSDEYSEYQKLERQEAIRHNKHRQEDARQQQEEYDRQLEERRDQRRKMDEALDSMLPPREESPRMSTSGNSIDDCYKIHKSDSKKLAACIKEQSQIR